MPAEYLDVDPELAAKGLATAVVVGSGIQNRQTSPELIAYRRQAAAELAAAWRGRSISDHPAIAGFHELHQQFGVSDEPASPEKLISYVRRHRDLTGSGAVVDCYNLVSASTLVSIGAHDLDRLSLPVSLRICRAEDRFTPLDGSAARPCTGEYGYVDPHGRVICRLDVLQGAETTVDEGSNRVAFFLQGNQCLGSDDLLRAAWYLVELLERFCQADAELVAFHAAESLELHTQESASC